MRLLTSLLSGLLLLSTAGRAAPVRGRVPTGSSGLAQPAPLRLNAILLDSLNLSAASSLPIPALAPAGAGDVATPIAFRQLAQTQAEMRVSAVVKRLAKAAAGPAAPAAAAQAPSPIRLQLAGTDASQRTQDPVADNGTGPDYSALERKTTVDVQELSNAVAGVMSGFTPAQIGSMSDEEFAAGAEAILAKLSGDGSARRSPLISPVRGNPSPEAASAFLRELGPDIQRLANQVMEMDPAAPKTCEACGPVSLAVRGPLRRALQKKFPDAEMDVLLEPGSLIEPGVATPHVFLKIVRRTGKLTVDPLAIADFTAAQKPENVKALGLRQGDPVILPWETGIYESRYPISRPTGSAAGEMMRRIEAARGPRSVELERRLDSFLNNY